MNPLWFHWFCVVFFVWVFPVLAISAGRQLLAYSLNSFLKSNIQEYPWCNQLSIIVSVNETIQAANYGISRMYYNLCWPFWLLSFCVSAFIALLSNLFKRLLTEITFMYVEVFCTSSPTKKE